MISWEAKCINAVMCVEFGAVQRLDLRTEADLNMAAIRG
jgi:hypothetical protein